MHTVYPESHLQIAEDMVAQDFFKFFLRIEKYFRLLVLWSVTTLKRASV